jgi:hypothetical protein
MKFYKIILVVTIVFLFSSCNHQDDKKEIEKLFSDYKVAVIKHDYKFAVGCFDSSTIHYYENLLNLSKYADSEKVASMSILDQLIILSTRMTTPKKEIEKMRTISFMESLYQTGGVSSSEIIKMNLCKLKINGNVGIGLLISDSTLKHINIDKIKTDNWAQFSFVKENQKWKINPLQFLKLGDEIFRDQMNEAKLNKQEFIHLIIENLKTEYNINDERELWKPMFSK